MNTKMTIVMMLALGLGLVSCASDSEEPDLRNEIPTTRNGSDANADEDDGNNTAEVSNKITAYTDSYGDVAYIPAAFAVSDKADERDIRTGLVVIGPDGSEYVWVSTVTTPLRQRNFGSFFSGNSISSYKDETDLTTYQAMAESVEHYGGFYMGRYEASYGSGSSLSDYVPASKRVSSSEPGRIWVQFSPQNATVACQNIYSDNPTVNGFFPWGVNWDTTLQWFVDTGNKTYEEVSSNSTSWGNYSNDTFSPNARGNYTGIYEEAKANNIYDMAGNNWEWTQERYGGTNYVMRSGGYNLMGGDCPGNYYPAAIRDPLPGNSNHPNVCFRVALYLTIMDDTTTGIAEVRI